MISPLALSYPKRFGVWCNDRNYKETFPKGKSISKGYMFSYPSKVSEKQFQKTHSAIVLSAILSFQTQQDCDAWLRRWSKALGCQQVNVTRSSSTPPGD